MQPGGEFGFHGLQRANHSEPPNAPAIASGEVLKSNWVQQITYQTTRP
jgi:hypothetical protein